MSRFGFIAKRCKEQRPLDLGARIDSYIGDDRVTIYRGRDGHGFYINNFVKERWYKLEYREFKEG